jgi:hypothetical protein
MYNGNVCTENHNIPLNYAPSFLRSNTNEGVTLLDGFIIYVYLSLSEV